MHRSEFERFWSIIRTHPVPRISYDWRVEVGSQRFTPENFSGNKFSWDIDEKGGPGEDRNPLHFNGVSEGVRTLDLQYHKLAL